MIPSGPSLIWTSQLMEGSAVSCRLIGPRPLVPDAETMGPTTSTEVPPVGLYTKHWICCPSGQRASGAISRVLPGVGELQRTLPLIDSSGTTARVCSVLE